MWRCFLPLFILIATPVAAYNDTKWISVPATSRKKLVARAQTRTNATQKVTETIPAIIGGTPAGNNEFPWFGRTEIVTADSFGNFNIGSCGASLIHRDIAVSAAHCIVDSIRDGYDFAITFYLGANEYDGTDGIELEVASAVYPTNYDFPINDMVFYKLQTATNVNPVSWNNNALTPLDGDVGTAIGFGLTSDDGDESSILLKVDLPAITTSECINFYGPDGVPDSITCVFDEDLEKSICQGDSGGPIITENGVLYGVTSFSGTTCGATPSGFTRTSFFTDFMSKVSTWFGLFK